MTNEETVRIANRAIAIALDEIRLLKQDVEKLKVQNGVYRSILLGMYRCNGIDAGGQQSFEEHLHLVHDYISGLAEDHPWLATVAERDGGKCQSGKC